MAIFRLGKRVGPFDIRLGLSRGKEYDNIPGVTHAWNSIRQ